MGVNKREEVSMYDLASRVADQVPTMLAYWDNTEICRFANAAYLAWFGKSKEEIINKATIKELFGKNYEENIPHIRGVLAGQAQKFDRERVQPDGSSRYIIVQYSPDIVDGEIKGFFTQLQEITETKKLERELSASENKFKSLLESASDPIIITDKHGLVQIANIQVAHVFGYSQEDLTGKSIELLIPDNLQTGGTIKGSLLPEEGSHLLSTGLEFTALHREGCRFPVEVGLSPILMKDGLYMALSVRDVTRQKEAERQLKESNERNRIFVQQAPNALAMFDRNMCYLAASEKWREDYKLTGTDIIGRSHYEIFPEIGEDWKKIHRDCLQGAVNHNDEAVFERADGSVQWITWTVRPWYVSEDQIGGLLMYTADITELKLKDLEKRKIEGILDKTNEVARIGTWEVDLVNNKVMWSRITREIHEVPEGYEPKLSEAIYFFKEGDSREQIRNAVENAIKTGKTYDLEVELVTAKGRTLWTRAIGQAEFKNGVCNRLYGIFQDIEEVKDSRDALARVNNELKTILNTGYVSIIGTDVNGLITHFNRGAEMMLQYSASEMIGIATPGLIHLPKEVIDRGHELSEFYGKEIKEFEVFVTVPRREAFESREWTYVRKDGSTFPVQLAVTAIKDSKGKVTGFLGVATDISAIKNSEKELKSLLQITTNQNERLKNFAHIVSHNLRSHTSNMEMTLGLFEEENEGAIDNEYIYLLKTALDNLKETIHNLNEVVLMNMFFSEKLVPVNLAAAIDSSANTVRQLLRDAGVEIINQVDKEIIAQGFPAYTDSVLLNFITNGIKYRSPERPAKIVFNAEVAGEYILVTIEDNGVGIDLEKNGSKLFGMYKTFHSNKDARGIGLFITKNQVEAMGGRIEVESELNKGTKFKLYLKNVAA